jgi:hypothetical protein
MQHVHNIEPLRGQRQALAPLRVTVVQPSVWERINAKVDQALSQERVAEAIFGAVTVLLAAGLFVSFARALAHYTIVPWP